MHWLILVTRILIPGNTVPAVGVETPVSEAGELGEIIQLWVTQQSQYSLQATK